MIGQTVLSLFVVWLHLGFAQRGPPKTSQQAAAIAFRSGQKIALIPLLQRSEDRARRRHQVPLRLRVCGTVICGRRLLQARIFDNNGALFNPLFTGDCRIAASKETSAEMSDRRARELGVGGELFRIGY